MKYNRRLFLKTTAKSVAAISAVPGFGFIRENQANIEVLNPQNRAPVSMIIDDSTALVNLAYYGIPQFAEVFPENYKQDWRKLPREIPDNFMREFAEWTAEHGVKGKYSMVPYPACTGWLSRFIPGWTKKELEDSLKLVREEMIPNWDIHPEMVSHTRVIDLKTGKPYPDATPEFMENWEWSQNKSADELATYQSFALQILKDAGLNCEGITTPGGYGSKNMDNFSLASLQSLRDVFGAEVSHYFRDLYTEKDKSMAPKVLLASDLDSADPKCVVSIIGCTGDWFGGWDGLSPGNADKFITEDLHTGRMVEVIESGEPAIMVCHWPGIYFNGEKVGFNILKQVVSRLNQKYNNLVWMKQSEIAHYWAAKELSSIQINGKSIKLNAPFAAPDFTLRIDGKYRNILNKNGTPFKQIERTNNLNSSTFFSNDNETVLCFDLQKGESELILS